MNRPLHPALLAERWARVLHVHVDSPTSEAERTLVIRVPTCAPGDVVYARITWKPEAPDAEDLAAHRTLKSQLKRLSGELRCTVLAG